MFVQSSYKASFEQEVKSRGNKFGDGLSLADSYGTPGMSPGGIIDDAGGIIRKGWDALNGTPEGNRVKRFYNMINKDGLYLKNKVNGYFNQWMTGKITREKCEELTSKAKQEYIKAENKAKKVCDIDKAELSELAQFGLGTIVKFAGNILFLPVMLPAAVFTGGSLNMIDDVEVANRRNTIRRNNITSDKELGEYLSKD